MSTPLVLVHPEPDYTGVNPDYQSINEVHDLAEKGSWVIVLNYGAFYAGSVAVMNLADGSLMKPGKDQDYVTKTLDPIATAKSSKTVHCYLEVSKAKYPIKPKISITYQFVGGPFQLNVAGLEQAVKDLETMPDEVYWDNILNKPVAYPPKAHTHKAADITHLDSTNAALWAIKLSIDHLAEIQQNESLPEDLVRYGGVTKYTIDQGINLHGFKSSTLQLEFPRSLSENALFALRCTYLSGGREYQMVLTGNEDPAVGFTIGGLEGDLINVVGITGVRFTAVNGKNYATMTMNTAGFPNGWGDGFLVVDSVVVWCDEPKQYNGTYTWLTAIVPTTGKNKVGVVRNLSVEDLTEMNKNHKVLVDNGVGFAARKTPLTLRFPRGVLDTHYIAFRIDIFRTTKESLTFMGLEDPATGYVNFFLLTKYDEFGSGYKTPEVWYDEAAHMAYITIDAANGELGTGYALVTEVTFTGNEQQLYNNGWAWDVARTGKAVSTAPTIMDERSFKHVHSMSDITGLPQSLTARPSFTQLGAGTELLSGTKLNTLVDTGHYRPPVGISAADLASAGYPAFVSPTEAQAGTLVVERLHGRVKQRYHTAAGRSYKQTLTIDESIPNNPSGVVSRPWSLDADPTNGCNFNGKYLYQFDMSALDAARYYLVEFVITGMDLTKLGNRAMAGPMSFEAAYNPDNKTGISNGKALGQCFGQVLYGANSNLGQYYNVRGLHPNVDASLFAFHSFFVCPVDTATDKFRVWMYVKGGGKLNIYTDAEAVVLHAEATVTVGTNASAVAVTTPNAVTTPTAVAGNWVKLCDIKPNLSTEGFPAP